MSTGVDELLDQAKKLSEAERRRLVNELAATLPEGDCDDDELWKNLQERIASGMDGSLSWDEVKKLP